MKQPLMLIPPAQAEVLSDSEWTDVTRDDIYTRDEVTPGNKQSAARLAPLQWLDDDMPDDAVHGSGTALPGEIYRCRLQNTLRAA